MPRRLPNLEKTNSGWTIDDLTASKTRTKGERGKGDSSVVKKSNIRATKFQ